MRKMLKFGCFMVLMFSFLLPTIFPMSNVSEDLPAVSLAEHKSVISDEAREFESKAMEEISEDDTADNVFYKESWVIVKNIDADNIEQYTPFSPITHEELGEAQSTSSDPWIAIVTQEDIEIKDNENKNNESEIKSNNGNLICENADTMDIKNLPVYPHGKDDKVIVNL